VSDKPRVYVPTIDGIDLAHLNVILREAFDRWASERVPPPPSGQWTLSVEFVPEVKP